MLTYLQFKLLDTNMQLKFRETNHGPTKNFFSNQRFWDVKRENMAEVWLHNRNVSKAEQNTESEVFGKKNPTIIRQLLDFCFLTKNYKLIT